MSLQNAAALISAFRTAAMSGGESVEKIEILRELEACDEPEVTRFLGDIAADPGEYDLARIEALRALEVRRFEGPETRKSVAHAILRVLSDDEDDQVRAWAARSLSNFTEVTGVVTVARTLVLDEYEDADVRHNAFFALERSEPTPDAKDAVTSCLGNDEFNAAAERVLAKWHALD